jgi:hypothetical protein
VQTVEAAHVPWRPLGELFVGRGLITESELETALVEQAATGKRLGEILVDRGLVSGPDLTSALMDQLGVEISKEEGYGSGLWAEIKRRHRRLRRDGVGEDDLGADELSEVPFLHAVEPEEVQVEEPPEVVVGAAGEAAVDHLDEVDRADEADSELEPEPAPEPVVLAPAAVAKPELDDPELEHEFDAIRVEYSPPPPIEFAAASAPEQEPETGPWPLRYPTAFSQPAFEEPELVESTPIQLDFAEPGYDPEPAPIVAAAPDPEPQPDPAPAARERLAFADVDLDDSAKLRAELAEARADLAHLQEMLEDSMIALAALTAERDCKPHAGHS